MIALMQAHVAVLSKFSQHANDADVRAKLAKLSELTYNEAFELKNKLLPECPKGHRYVFSAVAD
jgi:hypothetical protein